MKRLLLLFFALLSSLSNQASPDFIYVSTLSEWETVLSIAESKQRLIYVFYTADDCQPCESMLNTTLNEDRVEEHINHNFIGVSIKQGSSFARRFAEGFQIYSVPSSLWMTGQEFVWHMETGAIESDDLLRASQRTFELTRIYPEILPEALNGSTELSVKNWMDLLYIAGANRLEHEGNLVANFKENLHIDSLKSEDYWNFIRTYVSDLTSPLYQYIKLDWKQTLGSDFPWEDYYYELYDFNLRLAIRSGDSMLVENMEYHLLPTLGVDTAAPSNEMQMRKLNLWQEFYLGMENFTGYVEVTTALLKEVKPNSTQMASIIKELTSYSRSNYALDAGLGWIDEAIQRNPEVTLYIIKADVLLVRGKPTDAIQVLGDAERLDTTPTEEEQEMIDFLKYVAVNRY